MPSSHNKSSLKRKRYDTNHNYASDRKKKRVRKACIACKKSHLKCDGTRPCERCISKSINCQDESDVHQKEGYVTKLTSDGRQMFVKAEENVVQEATPQGEGNQPEFYIPPNTDHPPRFNTQPVLHQFFMENTLLKSEVNSLKETTSQQNQWLNVLIQQMNQQNLELNALRQQLALQKENKLLRVTHQEVVQLAQSVAGSYDIFADSNTHGVMVFDNFLSTTDSYLLAYNRAVCNFFNLNPEELQGELSTWLTMDINRPKSPLVLFNIVKSQKPPTNIFFVCSFPSPAGLVDVRINLFIEERQWWLVFDFSNFLIKQAENPGLFNKGVIQQCALTDSHETKKIPLSPPRHADQDSPAEKLQSSSPLQHEDASETLFGEAIEDDFTGYEF